MDKLILFLFSAMIVFSLSSCSSNIEREELPINGDSIVNSTTIAAEYSEIETTIPVNSANEDNFSLDIIVQKCGLPFRFYNPVDMELYCFYFFESHARREYSSFSDGMVTHDSLTWEIIGDEMIVSGDWNERFTLDLEAFTATSLADGMVYRIVSND